MRAMSCAALVAALGCSSKSTTGEDQPEPDPKGWTLTVDMSGLDRFVEPADAESWPIAGIATATEGLQSVTVGDALANQVRDFLLELGRPAYVAVHVEHSISARASFWWVAQAGGRYENI